jgi:hypothetical protein
MKNQIFLHSISLVLYCIFHSYSGQRDRQVLSFSVDVATHNYACFAGDAVGWRHLPQHSEPVHRLPGTVHHQLLLNILKTLRKLIEKYKISGRGGN